MWADNDAAKEAFRTDVSFGNIDKLPISDELKTFLHETASLYDCLINWEYPSDPPNPNDWTPEMAAEFDFRAHEAYDRIRIELGEDYEIIYTV